MDDMEDWPKEFEFARAEEFEHDREWMEKDTGLLAIVNIGSKLMHFIRPG